MNIEQEAEAWRDLFPDREPLKIAPTREFFDFMIGYSKVRESTIDELELGTGLNLYSYR